MPAEGLTGTSDGQCIRDACGPPLEAGECGRVHHKLLRGLVVSGGRLEPSHVAAVSQLGLGVRAEKVGLIGEW